MMKGKKLSIAITFLIVLVTIAISANIQSKIIKQEIVIIKTNDENNKYEVVIEADGFLEDWKKEEENGVYYYQMEETLEKLKIYKYKIEEDSESNTEILREIKSEIHWLEHAINSIINNPKRREIKAISLLLN